MSDTRSTVRMRKATGKGTFTNLRFACHHCGKKLKLITVSLFGVPTEVPCWGSCGCEESKLDGLDIPEADRKYARAGIPVRYLSMEVDLLGYDTDVRNGRSMYIHGPNGTGKSTFAANLAKSLVDAGKTVMFRNSKQLMEEIRKTFNGENLDFLDRCAGVDVLVIDDLGKEQTREYPISMLYQIIESRYSAMKPVVVVSNFDRAELMTRWSEADEATAEAIVSRLCDGVSVVQMNDRDWRLG